VFRVLAPPGKSWIFWGYNFRALEISGKWVWSWKVLEILVQGPGKSWNFLGYDVVGGHNAAGANLWLTLDTK